MIGDVAVRISIDKWVHKASISSWASKLFSLLVLTDVCFFVLSILAVLGRWEQMYPDIYSNPYFIEKDRGYAEFFQYMKEYWCVLLLGFIALKKRSPLYLSWMLLFLYLLVDDYAEIHEDLGLYLSNLLGFVPLIGLRARDFGEIVVSASVGLFFLSCIGIAYRLGDRVFRKASRVLIKLLLALAACGILVDLLHVMVPGRLIHAVGLLEDGGEMIVMSAIATFIFVLSEEISEKE